jgi:hypothetical protein
MVSPRHRVTTPWRRRQGISGPPAREGLARSLQRYVSPSLGFAVLAYDLSASLETYSRPEGTPALATIAEGATRNNEP